MDPEQIPLRDLHLPEAIGWWPLAPGWWLLMGLLAVGVGFLLRHYLRRRSQGAARRHALRHLDGLVDDYRQHRNIVTLAAKLSQLTRRTMLAYAPRQEVAGLTDEAWLAWLDRDLTRPMFVNGPGRKLLELPYRNPDGDIPAAEVDRLLAAVRHRLATPVGSQF